MKPRLYGAGGPREFPRHGRSGRVLTLHHAGQVARWTLWVAVAACGVCAFEALVLHGRAPIERIAARPLSFARQVLGFPHFIIAFYFLLTSSRLRSAAGWLRLGGLAVGGVALCLGFAALGGYGTGLAYVLMIHYFLFHVFRDEAFFHRTHAGTAIPPAEQRTAKRAHAWMEVAALSLIAAFLIPFHVVLNRRAADAAWSPPEALAVVGAPLLALCLLALWRLHRTHAGGLRGAWRDHWPLALVLIGCDTVLCAGLVLGAWTIELLVLFHFVGWFYFAVTKIRRQPPAVRAGATWRTPHRWFKHSVTGFWALHGGLALVFLALYVGAFWLLPSSPVVWSEHAFRNALAVPLNDTVFYHLTVVHVSLSLFPR